jgi:hypothetical protein
MFMDNGGRLFPSEGVHGWGYCSEGAACGPHALPDVNVLFQDGPGRSVTTGKRARGPDGTNLMSGWAAWTGAHFDGLTGVLCFSRRVHSRSIRVSPNIMPGALCTRS